MGKIRREEKLRNYLEKYNEEFIKRYLTQCITQKYEKNIISIIKYLGREIRTGEGLHRVDMAYYIDAFTPIIVIIELKDEVCTDAIIQLSNYIKELKKTRRLEKKQNNLGFPRNHLYIGIVAGRWVRPIVKDLIRNDLSNSLSYIDFRNNSFKCLEDDQCYEYTDDKYWFECGMWE